MPTLVRSEGFEYRVLSAESDGGTGNVPLFTAVNQNSPGVVAIDTTTFNNLSPGAGGSAALSITGDTGAVQNNVLLGLGTGVRILAGSIYFRIPAGSEPSSESAFFGVGAGPAVVPLIVIQSDGSIGAWMNSAVNRTGNVCDGIWHRVDFLFRTDSTTFTIDWAFDGTAQTQKSLTGQTAADMTSFTLGANNAVNNIANMWFDDLVLSTTAADHPIGGHRVKGLAPNADGTHSATLVAGDMDMSDGTDILTSTTTAWQEVDSLPPTVNDYIQQTAGTTADYAEVAFPDPGVGSTIWHVEGQTSFFGSTATSCQITVRVVDSGGATIANILNAYAMTINTLAHRRLSVIANPTETAVNGYKVRIGFSGDVAPDPRVAGVNLQVAYPVTDQWHATPTPGVVAAIASVPAVTIEAGATPTPGVVAALSTVPDVTVDAGAGSPDATATPGTVAAIAAVGAATASAGATATPDAVAGVSSVPAPSLSTGSTPTPATVASTASVPSVTMSTGSTATPGVVAAIASVGQAAIQAGSTVLADVVAAIAGVWQPTVDDDQQEAVTEGHFVRFRRKKQRHKRDN